MASVQVHLSPWLWALRSCRVSWQWGHVMGWGGYSPYGDDGAQGRGWGESAGEHTPKLIVAAHLCKCQHSEAEAGGSH